MTQAQIATELAQAYAAGALGFRNRIINGAGLIAQRATTFTGVPGGYQTVDRFGCSIGSGSGHTVGQVLDGPAGFLTCFGVTIGTGAAPVAANFSGLWHNIEGYGVSDFGYGKSWAKVGVLSFAVKSSIPGNYSVSFMNGALNRHYLLNYSISVADAWEKKSLILPGDIAGTWDGGSGNGLSICWDLGSGSNYEDVIGVWAANQKYRDAAAVKLVATSGAIFRVTGAQFELGYIPTPFELRSIASELNVCQRYYQILTHVTGGCRNGTIIDSAVQFPVFMRKTPDLGFLSGTTLCALNNVGVPMTAVSAWVGGNGAGLGLMMTASTGNFATGIPGFMYNGGVTLSAEL